MKCVFASLDTCGHAEGTVVAVDVLRAFSTAAYAFSRGVREICLVSELEEGRLLKAQHPDWLLMGEVGGVIPEGFDYGNSPLQLMGEMLEGRRLIQRTSAGTQGVVRSVQAGHILSASFVVADATVGYLQSLGPEQVTFVITGGERNMEDLACAEYLELLLRGKSPNPAPFLKRVLESEDAQYHLDPKRVGFPYEDLDFCTRVSAFSFAMPVFREQGRFVMRPVRVD